MSPPSEHPFLNGLRPTLHIAHRGGAALFPENTMEAFRGAVDRYRTDMLELDVHLSRDGELVVSHDPTVDRCTDGTGAIAQGSLSELQRLDAGYRFTPDGGATFPFRGQGLQLPTLRQVLRAFPSVRMNVELKADAPEADAAFAECLRAEGALFRVCVGSELDAVAQRLAQVLPDACLFYPRNALEQLVLALKTGRPAPTDERFRVLDMPLFHHGMRLVDRPFLDAARGLGKWVNVWTVDDPGEMRRLIADGVGGIMTDRPDLLRDALDAN